MIFGLFKKHCYFCGKDVEKETVLKRFGGLFCSEEHVKEHKDKIDKALAKKPKGGGCCG